MRAIFRLHVRGLPGTRIEEVGEHLCDEVDATIREDDSG